MVLIASSFIIPVIMISPFAEISSSGRLTALGLNENFSAIMLSLSFAYISIAAREQKTNFSSLILYLLALVPLYGVIATGTRMGLLFCAFFICVFLYKIIAKKFGKFLAALTVSLIMLVGIFFAIGSDLVVIIRLLELTENITTEGRFVIWMVAIDSVGGNYISGIGPKAYSNLTFPIFGSFMSPHNVLFEFYIYGGLVGTLLSLPILYAAMSGIRSKSHIGGGNDIVYFTSIILIIIFMLHHIVFNKLFWFLMALVYRLSHELKLSYENNNSN